MSRHDGTTPDAGEAATPSAGELRLLGRVSSAEAAARSGLAGDAAEMDRVAKRRGALDGGRVLLAKLRRRGRPDVPPAAPVVVTEPDTAPEL